MKQQILSLAIVCVAAFGSSCSDDNGKNNGGITPPENTTYKVLDLYEQKGVKGIVFKLDDQRGEHGLIVSLDEGEAQWSTEAVKTAAVDEADGAKNQAAIEAIAGWQTTYPAFAWCGAKNTAGVAGWFLPAAAQVLDLYEVWAANQAAFNKLLTDNGGKAITISTQDFYWTSSENLVKSGEAAMCRFDRQGAESFLDKWEEARVRAVYAF